MQFNQYTWNLYKQSELGKSVILSFEDNGKVDSEGKASFTWSAEKTTIRTFMDGENVDYSYSFNNGKLTLYYDGESVTYIKD